MNEHDPNKTLPPRPGPTETQRFTPVHPDDTNPHMKIAQFPKGESVAETPPGVAGDLMPGVVYEYGGIELQDAVRLPNGDVKGTEGNGIPLVIPAQEFKMFKPKK